MNPLIETAYSWHGGQWSPLYSFASTGGVVWTEEHREGLVGEILECRTWCLERLEMIDSHRLWQLLRHVQRAELKVPLEVRETCAK